MLKSNHQESQCLAFVGTHALHFLEGCRADQLCWQGGDLTGSKCKSGTAHALRDKGSWRTSPRGPAAACLLGDLGTELLYCLPREQPHTRHGTKTLLIKVWVGNSASAFTKQRTTAPYTEHKLAMDSDIWSANNKTGNFAAQNRQNAETSQLSVL